jgi:branched-chain amino acid transport system permease protein
LAFSGSEESVAGSLGWGNFHADKDTAVLAGVLLLAGILWILTNSTRMGLAYKAVSSNRELAQQYGLPIRKIDLLVILLAGGLCSLGGVINGLRYGLTADMMTANALKVVAVVVALGPERLPAIAIGLLCIGVLESYCQASIRFSAFEQGVSFAVLAVALVIRHCAAPIIARIRGAHYARGVEQSPEANP